MTLYPNSDKEVDQNYAPLATTKKRDLIDRGQITYTWWELPGGKYSDGVTLQSVIHSMPTVDAVEVVHARWIMSKEKDTFGYINHFHCSQCGRESKDVGNYCSNCGAKMDGDKHE